MIRFSRQKATCKFSHVIRVQLFPSQSPSPPSLRDAKGVKKREPGN